MNFPLRMLLVGWGASLAFFCTSCLSPPKVAHDQLVKLADAKATEIIEEFNQSETAKKYGLGPFSLSQYERSIVESYDPDTKEPILSVSYENPSIDFPGHPGHFWVWIHKKTGRVEWLAGE